MAKHGTSKPTAAVVGLGDYYSTKLRSGLSRHFDCVAFLDSDPRSQQVLLAGDRSLFRLCNVPKDLGRLTKSAQVVIVLTPSHLHVPYALEAINLGKAVIVEKPIAVSSAGLESLREVASRGARLYCSDFYADVRAIPLLAAMGHFCQSDWQENVIENESSRPIQRMEIGEIQRIEGRIAEDSPFLFDSWAGRRPSGGVILEMMVHLFALLKRLFPNESMDITESKRLYANLDGTRGAFAAAPSSPELAEGFAQVNGELTISGARVSFEVLKQAHRTDRYLRLIGKNGSLTQFFGSTNQLEAVIGSKSELSWLKEDRYDLTCLAMRKWFDSGAVPYGFAWSEWAAEKSAEARDWQPPVRKTISVDVKRPSPDLEEHINEGRRRILTGVGLNSLMLLVNSILIGATTAVSTKQALDEQRNVATRDTQRAAEKTGRFVDVERIDAISRLVGTSKRLVLAPGSEHPDLRPVRGIGYPHDLSALAPFRHLIRGPILELDFESIPDYVRAGDIIVGTGSPTSSFLAKSVMAPGTSLVDYLPYRIDEIKEDRFVRVISGMLGGKEELKKGKRLIDSATGEEIYTDRRNVGEGGWLKRDVLVVSRVPSGHKDCDLVLISGGHGAGTQAIELLFDPVMISPEDMEYLNFKLKGSHYWQFVLEINDIHHEPGFMSLAHSVRLNPDCPPMPFNPPSQFLAQV